MIRSRSSSSSSGLRLGAASAAAAALLAGLAGTAAADGANELTFGATARTLHSDSANAVTDDGMTSVSLGAGRRLPLALPGGLSLAAEVGFDYGTVKGTMFQTMPTETSRLGLGAGLRAQRPLWRSLSATGRAALVATRTSLELSPIFGGAGPLSDHAWAPAAELAAGLETSIELGRPEPRFSLGLRIELGYSLGAPVELTARPEAGDRDGTLHLPVADASLGDLDLDGWTLHWAAFSRF
jgi:hypothetical protein